MSWSIGGIIVAAATYGYNQRNDQWAWRVPLALQWIFPVSHSSSVLLIFCLRKLTLCRLRSWFSFSSLPNPRGG